jgi:hypothetical protein
MDVNYGSPGTIKVKLTVTRPRSYALESYVVYTQEGKGRPTNAVSLIDWGEGGTGKIEQLYRMNRARDLLSESCCLKPLRLEEPELEMIQGDKGVKDKKVRIQSILKP